MWLERRGVNDPLTGMREKNKKLAVSVARQRRRGSLYSFFGKAGEKAFSSRNERTSAGKKGSALPITKRKGKREKIKKLIKCLKRKEENSDASRGTAG